MKKYSSIENLSESENNNIFIIDEFDNSNETSSNGCELLDRLTPGTADFIVRSQELANRHMVKHSDISGMTIIAATFTYPLDTIYKVATEVAYTKQGTAKNKKINIYLKDMPENIQWEFFKKDFCKFLCDIPKKHSFCVFGYECYPELTKAGLIHIHASLYIHCEGWAMARSHAMAEIWCKISKGKMKAMISTNRAGKQDYAFAKCNDVASWSKYCRKEQSINSVNSVI